MAHKRWYDKYEKLSRHLHSLENMDADERDKLIRGIAQILSDHQIRLDFDDVLDFPMELPRRRWYDHDPYMWLIMNGLQHADVKVVGEVEEFLEIQMGV